MNRPRAHAAATASASGDVRTVTTNLRNWIPLCRSQQIPREWSTMRRGRTYSGGTAPDFHRTSLLCPRGHPSEARLHHPHLRAVKATSTQHDKPLTQCFMCHQGHVRVELTALLLVR